MGINPTPTNHRSFTFDGKSTREFGVYITGEGVFNAPERAVEMISIPGRDGEYALDQGHFNNIEVTYRAGIVADSTTDFAEAISNFRNWLASREGYCRLTDEYNTEEYRMAVFKNAIALKHEGLLTGEFDVTFDCKPQRFLAIGEELTEIGAWGNTETAEGEIVTIEASSDTAVKALTADIDPIQDLHGYDAPWVGGAGKNKLQVTATIQTVNGVTITVDSNGVVTLNGTATAATNFVLNQTSVLADGTYILTGANDGQSGARYYLYSTRGFVGGQNVAKTYDSGQALYLFLHIESGAVMSASTDKIYPMIRLASVTDATFAPYANICPISGHTEVDVERTGKNLWHTDFTNTNVGTGLNIVKRNGEMTIDAEYGASTTYLLGGGTEFINYRLKKGTYTLSAYSDTFSGICVTLSDNTTWSNGETKTFANDVIINNVRCSQANFEYNTHAIYYWQLQIERGSTPTSYEPYNGTTYTTTLPSTTYGGTLDVVSGVLTVDRVIINPTVCISGYERQNGDFIGRLAHDGYASNNYDTPNIICNCATAVGANYQYTGTSTTVSINANNGDVLIVVSEKTTKSELDAWLAMNQPQIVYPLATPQTYQLTPQQVELLLGENHIFADSGNVTVEYGHNPTLLTNPTWFPSKPLLYAEGYGDINLGSRTITVSDEPIGEVLLANKIDRNPSNRSYFDTATLALLNVGDTITVSSGSQLIIGLASSSTSTTITSITATVTGGTAQAIGAPSTYVDHYGDGRIEITMDAFDFANGTTEKATVELDVTVNYKENGTTKSWSSTEFVAGYRYSVVYNAVSFAGFEVEPSLPDDIYSYIPRDATIENIYGYSTKQITADGYYIDLDIGEAYTMVDGVPSSINNLVTMPSDLPTLPPGDTEVTYDNTITKVEVKPNWWKV